MGRESNKNKNKDGNNDQDLALEIPFLSFHPNTTADFNGQNVISYSIITIDDIL